MALPADIRARHPEFGDVGVFSDATLQFWLDIAARNINVTQWGGRADDALIELACHMMVQAQASGSASPSAVVSESVGGVSASYVSSSGELRNDTEISATSYGRTFLMMRRLIMPLRTCF
jgi:hypothetical protein